MTDRERFKALVHFKEPDYVPIFGFPGAGGMSDVPLPQIRKSLIDQGMPEWVGAECAPFHNGTGNSWQRYWGTTRGVSPA